MNRMDKQDLHRAHEDKLIDEFVLENALISLKIKENSKRNKIKEKRMEEKRSILYH